VKLILRKDVAKLGLVGDVVEVSEGYARNYLLPHHVALEPNSANLKIIEVEKKKAAEERARHHEFLKQMAARIAATEVTIPAAANPEGHLYGSVGVRDISRALIAEGFSVQPDQVRLEEPIKKLDTIMVPIHLAEDLETQVKVWVVPEKTAADLAGETQERDHGADTNGGSEAAPG
jgi:large subunit ribosomal protein L9